MTRVQTDIRTGLPLTPDAYREAGAAAQESADRDRARSRGVSETPQAEALRQIVFEEMVQRIAGLLSEDETLKAMLTMLRRIGLAEVRAEEAAQRLMPPGS